MIRPKIFAIAAALLAFAPALSGAVDMEKVMRLKHEISVIEEKLEPGREDFDAAQAAWEAEASQHAEQLPEKIRAALAIEPSERTELQRQQLTAHFAVHVPQFAEVARTLAAKREELAKTERSEWAFLDNGIVRLGVRKDLGACIGWFSLSGSERNVLNTWDAGRFVQQSFYGDVDGAMWLEKPWRWNPVQGGDFRSNPSRLIAFEATPQRIYAKTQPRHWASGAELADVTMEEWLELDGGAAHLRFRMTYSGATEHRPHHQELPATFFNSDLRHLVFYGGDQPWTRGELTRKTPGAKNEYDKITEHWAAWVNDRGWGAGVFNPTAKEITDYFVALPQGPRAAECAYFAPIATFAVKPGLVFEHDAWLLLGTIEEIRDAAYRLKR